MLYLQITTTPSSFIGSRIVEFIGDKFDTKQFGESHDCDVFAGKCDVFAGKTV